MDEPVQPLASSPSPCRKMMVAGVVGEGDGGEIVMGSSFDIFVLGFKVCKVGRFSLCSAQVGVEVAVPFARQPH